MRGVSFCVAALSVSAGAVAQTVEPIVPKCAMWNARLRAEFGTTPDAAPFLPPGWNRDEGQFEQMVHLVLAEWEADVSGDHWGRRAAAEVLRRKGQGRLTDDHVVLIITNPNFHEFADGTDSPSPFFYAVDGFASPPGGWDPDDLNWRRTEYNPWMTHGVAQAKTWMEDFINGYNAHEDGAAPTPSQVVFDEEAGFYGFSTNSMRAWQQWATDTQRWGNREVPGFGTTLEQIYTDAATVHGFPPPSNAQTAVRTDLSFSNELNQRFNLWFSNVSNQIMRGAMKEAFYDPIHAGWGNNCIVSNYEDYTADGAPQVGQWHCPGYELVSNVPLTRNMYRVVQSGFGASAWYLPIVNSSTQQHLGVWFTNTGEGISDLRTPALYYVMTEHHQPDPYRAVQLTDTNEVRWNDTLRVHRHTLEAIVNSPGVNVSELSPWVMLPGTVNKAGNLIAPGDREVREQQMLLRSKRIGRQFVWYNEGSLAYATLDETTTPPTPIIIGHDSNGFPIYIPDVQRIGNAWDDFRRVFWQVYAPHLEFVQVVNGANHALSKNDALEDTLLYEGEPWMCRLYSIDAPWERASIEVKAKNLNSMRASKLGVYVELSAVSEQAGEAPGITEARVSLYNRVTQQWESHDHTLPAHSEGGYVDQAGRLFVESTLGIENYLSDAEGGSVQIQIGLARPRQGPPLPARPRFIANFDLVQVVGLGEGPSLGTAVYALDREKSYPASGCEQPACVIDPQQSNYMAVMMEDDFENQGILLRFDGPVTLGSALQHLELRTCDLWGYGTGTDVGAALDVSVAGDNTIAVKRGTVASNISGRMVLSSVPSGIVCQGRQDNGAAEDVEPFTYHFFLVSNSGSGQSDYECGPQDFNGDGDSGTDQDIEAFFACLGGNCCQDCWHLGADFNGDGDTGTDQDIEAFFRVLGGGFC